MVCLEGTLATRTQACTGTRVFVLDGEQWPRTFIETASDGDGHNYRHVWRGGHGYFYITTHLLKEICVLFLAVPHYNIVGSTYTAIVGPLLPILLGFPAKYAKLCLSNLPHFFSRKLAFTPPPFDWKISSAANKITFLSGHYFLDMHWYF